jgi:hypothetical protein
MEASALQSKQKAWKDQNLNKNMHAKEDKKTTHDFLSSISRNLFDCKVSKQFWNSSWKNFLISL